MKPCLVVCYSHTGVTARVAAALANRLGADLETIEEVRPRQGASGYLRSVWEALRQRPAHIVPPRHDPARYPFIVLGTPVWAGHMSAPMRSYIMQQRDHFKRLALFCTMGGSGGRQVLSAMAELSRRAPVATLCLRQQEVLADRYQPQLTSFASELALVEHGT
jgi:flavodoxin